MGVAILFVAGLAIAALFERRNAKSTASEIVEKARLEAEVLKSNEVMKGKEESMTLKSEAEKQANARLAIVQASEAKLDNARCNSTSSKGIAAQAQ